MERTTHECCEGSTSRGCGADDGSSAMKYISLLRVVEGRVRAFWAASCGSQLPVGGGGGVISGATGEIEIHSLNTPLASYSSLGLLLFRGLTSIAL